MSTRQLTSAVLPRCGSTTLVLNSLLSSTNRAINSSRQSHREPRSLKSHPDQSYAVFLPSNYTPDTSLANSLLP